MSLRVYIYEKCSTCRDAVKFLRARNIPHKTLPIREQPPTFPELREMLGHYGGDVRRLFNSSGQDYRAMNLKERLPKLSTDEALALLSSEGNLVKRPFALGEGVGLLGFKQVEWEKLG